ncbi:tripartite tricarboxylate transporter substrate-binding protein [Roseomonas marmotae]|uniref:Tripartite tricarboxylate transporter substrate binding protein BugD n=1 Tax=Roseomonas marmotae TaxID=2768161 RepID=A0ABS3KHE2_9PROT|nr:tripartite tricarboxylate transporter substrate-binding protein [Roseomonas marmotae]MBO1076879.1 tripartite tricarboxylate transporter substrate binding protein BugD [Roseomonas marmotae]QTI81129.1 tripartite tricarboxylate transporter substrate binding protein BugD [Roseomonas marmotae]
MLQRRTLLAAGASLLATPALRSARAQGFPDRPITITVPFTAGGPTDVISRLVAEGMSKDLGQPVVVENVTGAGGTIAAARVAQARPDGHTLLMHHIGHASTATLYRKLPYDVQESFAPLGLVSDAAMTVVARPDFPARDLTGVLAAIREQGDVLTLAHSGLGGANQLCGMLLQRAAGRALTSVVFRGSAPAITDMMAGRIDLFCDQATNTAPFIRDNRIKAYAVTLPQRVAGLDLPTTAEAGAPDLLMSTWHGLYAPRGTPAEVQERLSTAIRAALRDERLLARFRELVTAPASQDRATPAYHTRYLAEEVARWRPIIQEAGQYAD